MLCYSNRTDNNRYTQRLHVVYLHSCLVSTNKYAYRKLRHLHGVTAMEEYI